MSSLRPSVCALETAREPLVGRNSFKFEIGVFHEELSSHFNFNLDRKCLTSTFYEALHAFLGASRFIHVLTGGEYMSNRSCRENWNAHIVRYHVLPQK
jgi:hypothetical protein